MRVRRRALSPAVMTVFSFVGAALVVASNSAVTPLYRLYQQSMHLTPLMITLVYAVYAMSAIGGYCCKSPKSNNPKNLTKVTSPHTKRISGSENFRSSPQKDFFNNIGAKRTSGRRRVRR